MEQIEPYWRIVSEYRTSKARYSLETLESNLMIEKMDEVQSYLERLNFLDTKQTWMEIIKTLPETTESKRYILALSQVLNHFQEFVRDYFAYFSTSTQPVVYRGMIPPIDKPPTNLTAVLSRLRQEWTILYAVGHQWTLPAADSGISTALGQAIKDSFEYYSRYNGEKNMPQPLIYFEKEFAIRRAVYTDCPIISIPFEQYQGDGKLVNKGLALAHELGHFIFWNAADADKIPERNDGWRYALLQAFAQQGIANGVSFFETSNLTSMWSNWLEETIADICGTLMSGSQFVVSAYERMIRECYTEAELTSDDEEHPMPILRFQIALETLKFASTDKNRYSLLESALNAQVDGLILPDTRIAENTITYSHLQASVGKAVEIILTTPLVWKNDQPAVRLLDLFKLAHLASEDVAVIPDASTQQSTLLTDFLGDIRDKAKRPKQTDNDGFGRMLKRLRETFDDDVDVEKALLETEFSEKEQAAGLCCKLVCRSC